MELKKFYSEIHKRFGNITRARGHFLYTQKNIRLTDMYREEGRAVLGWTGGANTVLKNNLSKGLVGSFLTANRARLEKAVGDLLKSKRKVFVYSKKESALRAALLLNKESTAFCKPLSNIGRAGDKKNDFSKVKSVVLYPPFAWTKNIFIVAALCDDETNGALLEEQLTLLGYPPEILPPVLEAALSRAFYDLIAAEAELKEKDFFVYDKVLTKFWERDGCYLAPKVSEKKYDGFVLFCLDCNIVISPDYNTDSIVPFGVDEGVFKKLAKCETELFLD